MSTLPAVLSPCVSESSHLFSLSTLLHAFIYKSKWPEILGNFTCKGRGTSQFLIVSAVWSDAGLVPYGNSTVQPLPFSTHLFLLFSQHSVAEAAQMCSAVSKMKHNKSSRPTRWCRCRQKWWRPSWEWSQWFPAWPRWSPPYFPCLGFPFPHHCRECLPFSLEKPAVFFSDQSGAGR